MRAVPLLCLAALLALPPVSVRAVSSSPVDLLQEGLEAFLDERYDDAIKSFQSVLEYDKKNEAALRGIKSAQQKKEEQIARRRALEKPALEAARQAMDHEDWAEAVDKLDAIL